MDRNLFRHFVLSLLFIAWPSIAAAGNQIWKVRPGDNLESITMALEVPQEEIKRLNPGVSENNLQIGQKLKLPLHSYAESKAVQEELDKRAARIDRLEKVSSELENRVASAEAQLLWHPVWLWGFWICFGIIAFIICGAYWIFRATHPRVFEQPHERSIRDLQQSQTRVRSTFPQEDEAASSGGGWQPSLKRLTHTG